MSGKSQNLSDCETSILNEIDKIKDNIYSVMITDKQKYIVLRDLKKDPNFYQNYIVNIKKIGNIFEIKDLSNV